MALSSWRAKTEAEGFALEHGFKPWLDLRFADDIFLFYTTLDKACLLLDEPVASFAEVALTLNPKSKIGQLKPNRRKGVGVTVTVDVLDRASTHKARVFAPCRRWP